MKSTESHPVLELRGLALDSFPAGKTVDLKLNAGELKFFPGASLSLILLGIRPPRAGEVRFLGRTWEERNAREVEEDRRRIGVVVNPNSHPARIWVGNLDIDENVHLSSQFDPARSSRKIEERAAALAAGFGLAEGLPTSRPSATGARESILAQWVRAFLPDPLRLLILEHPVEYAPHEGAGALVEAIGKARESGTAVLWVDHSTPSIEGLGLEPDNPSQA